MQQKNRLTSAYFKIFNKKPNFNITTDFATSMSLTWLLGCMGVDTSTNNPSFHIEYGYVFSDELKQNFEQNTNLSIKQFSAEDLKKIDIIKDSLSQYKQQSLKEQVLQATACFSFLRHLASEQVVVNELSVICPHYHALVKQAKITYNEIQNQNAKLKENNYNLE